MKHFERKSEPVGREELANALRVIQDAVRLKYGEEAQETGEGTVYIGPRLMELTNLNGTIIARDVTEIAKSLSRGPRIGRSRPGRTVYVEGSKAR